MWMRYYMLLYMLVLLCDGADPLCSVMARWWELCTLKRIKEKQVLFSRSIMNSDWNSVLASSKNFRT